MNTQIMIQSTPNPNALKFVLNKPVKTEGNITYKGKDTADDNPLAKVLFETDEHIKEVYFFDNYITITQDGSADWDDLEQKIKTLILEKIDAHNPDFAITLPKTESQQANVKNPDIDQIDRILEQSIRPALQMDGGDVRVEGYENNTVTIAYQGACGSCPSATMGTLYAIENILKEQFNPDVNVVLADGAGM
ncbi:hypothetical protein MNBD_UNCLBAC01-443 [hydrothermal vent metagenome]|uniref:Scaffold protein Nfu/NifU N-terminal domain-containing protein n=1 Tax=hydrothermal vent metagenome TaxID=652676 RepID=A0A3B1DF95_9ZZZZ